MVDPNLNSAEVTRVLFEGFPSWAIGLFYVIGFCAIAVFCYGWYIQYRKYARGQPLRRALPRISHRLRSMTMAVLSHSTLRRRDHSTGSAHALIFFGFSILFTGTVIITLDYDVFQNLFGITFWHGKFYLFFSLVLDIAGVALAVGLLYMMIRRGWIKPPKLDYKRPDRLPDAPDADRTYYRIEDWGFLWLLLVIDITGYLLEAARLVWLSGSPDVWDNRWWSPIGAIIAEMMQGAGLSSEAAGKFRVAMWWFHAFLALGLIALIPFTKAKHIFTAMASLALRDPSPIQKLAPVNMEADRIGATSITDFTWKQLINFDACTKCGRCHEACPANAIGAPLSPRDLILTLRELSERALSKSNLPDAQCLVAQGDKAFQVASNTLWSCRTCAACVEICPVGIEHVPVIVEMRRALVDQGDMDPMLQKALQNIQKRGNSFGENKKRRPAWTQNLGFDIKDARNEPVDVLWFVGDFASFDPRYQRVSRDFARILKAAGVDFGILYEDESNAGNDVRRVGEEGLYQFLAENNIDVLHRCTFNRIVTTDPHSFNTLKNEYSEFGGVYEVEHASTLIARLLREKRIPLKKSLEGRRVTFHDPCHLGRYNKVFDAPRDVIQSLGCNLIELDRSRDNSFCCGAGGGRIWIPDLAGKEKPSEKRVREAAGIENLETLVVSCPKCMNMLEDARKTTNNEETFEIREMIELVAECLDDTVVSLARA